MRYRVSVVPRILRDEGCSNMPKGKRSSPRSRKSDEPAPPPFFIGGLRTEQCVGGPWVDPFHPKPFIGISDIAELTFCEIQSTISQLVAQQGHLDNAALDDMSGGVCEFKHDTLRAGGRTKIEQSAAKLIESGRVDWETRRYLGCLLESLELQGISSERRHFEFDHFFVIGCPDGISGNVVTEFASSRSPQLRIPAKQIQGNLYAVLWRKPSARVIVVGTESNERLDTSAVADAAEAERWLRRAWALLSGAEVPRPADYVGKCKRCRFNIANGCPYPRDKRVPNVAEMRTIAAAC
jgi:hypothetical protein